MDNLLKNLKVGDRISFEAVVTETDSPDAEIALRSYKQTNFNENGLIKALWIVDLAAKIDKKTFKLI